MEVKPQCFVCSQEDGPFMDPMPCACRGSIALHPECFEELRQFYSACSTCHTEYPPEIRDGLRVKRGIYGGYRFEGTIQDDNNDDDDDDYDCWHGTFREWDEQNKLVKEYNYDNGNKHGICIQYNTNGIIIKKYNYHYGNKNGLCTRYYDSGQIMNEYTFRHGKEHGTSRRYFQNGQLAEETTYIYDVCEGISRTYISDGSLHVCSSFKDGHLDGFMFTFNREGRIISRELYKEDRIIETIRY